MPVLYQGCADALDALEQTAYANGVLTGENPVVFNQSNLSDAPSQRAKMAAIRNLQEAFITKDKLVRVDALLGFCRQNDYKLSSYSRPGGDHAQFVLTTPSFDIQVQAH